MRDMRENCKPMLSCTIYDFLAFCFTQYCRTMRDQILESFGHRDFSLMVVGNKYDLVDVHPHSQVSFDKSDCNNDVKT